MPPESTLRRITRVSAGKPSLFWDYIATEHIVSIIINHVEYARLSCTPANLGDLGLGFLWSEGLIDRFTDVPVPEIDDVLGTVSFCLPSIPKCYLTKRSRQRVVLPGCGSVHQGVSVPPPFTLDPDGPPLYQISWEDISRVSSELVQSNDMFRQTGGTHAAGLLKGGSLIVLREDIGRHNAVDKIGGYILSQRIDTSQAALIVTGRMSSDTVLKAARFGIPVISSRGAPTSMAVALALGLNMTLIGFSRALRMNIYTSPERILTLDP